MRTTGIVLTGLGVGLATAGIVLLNSSPPKNYNNMPVVEALVGETVDVLGNALGGIILLSLGVASTGGGITLWAIGNNKMKKYGNTINLQSTKNGLGLAYSF